MRKPGSASLSDTWALTGLSLSKIRSPQEFEQALSRIRLASLGIQDESKAHSRFLQLMYYLLGWMVGDAGKGFHTNQKWARFQLELCRGHEENLILGNFVMECIDLLGIPWTRIADRPPHKGEPHGTFRWQSYYSEVFVWLHIACLGLARHESTTRDQVRMTWLLSSSPECRLWFLRGIADSDGSVSIRNRRVVITSEPNADFFRTLLVSLGVKTCVHRSRGIGYVSVLASDSEDMRIFNPEVETHRSKALHQLARAKAYQRHWPDWLETKVESLLQRGTDVSSVRNKLLFEDGIYVKLRTLKNKQSNLKERASAVI